jgi:L-lactate dehydrogenase complex protein LldF
MLAGPFKDMLRCIRCGACMNHCPVYQSIGGHAYGWVYPGPMGAVLTPSFIGLEKSSDLPNASTFCGQCESVCPVRIPLPGLMRLWRERAFSRQLMPWTQHSALALWAFFAKHPKLYRSATSMAMSLLGLIARGRDNLNALPFLSAWTKSRDFPAPQGATFQSQWAKRNMAPKP